MGRGRTLAPACLLVLALAGTTFARADSPATGGSLSGVVRDEMTGMPIAGLCVSLIGDAYVLQHPIGVGNYNEVIPRNDEPTASDGAWQINNIPAGVWVLYVGGCSQQDPRYVGEFYDNASQRDDASRFLVTAGDVYVVPNDGVPVISNSWLDLRVKPRTGMMGGVTSSTGVPLAGVCVKAFWSQTIPGSNTDLELQSGGGAVRTDANGEYLLAGPDDVSQDGSSLKIGFYPCDAQLRSDPDSPWRGQFWHRSVNFAEGHTIVFRQGEWLLDIDAVLDPR